MEKKNGIGLFGILGVVFVILKLCKVITWSWWLVTLPFWVGIPILIIILIIYIFAVRRLG